MNKNALSIQRIKQKWREYENGAKLSTTWRLCPCLGEAEVTAFEKKYQVRLPEEYRRFLLEIGNGEVAVRAKGAEVFSIETVYGIRPFTSQKWPIARLEEYWGNLAKPCLLSQPIIWEGAELTDDEKTKIESLNCGSLFVCNSGCGQHQHLIVTGPERGNMMTLSDVGSGPFEPRTDFLTWYEELVDGRLAAHPDILHKT